MAEQERRDLARYRDLLHYALRSVSLTRNEALLLYDALQLTIIDASTARQLHLETQAAIRHNRLDEKHSVDTLEFMAKLTAYNDLQRMAIIDAIEQAGDAASDTFETRLIAAGLPITSRSTDDSAVAAVPGDLRAWISQTNATYAPEHRRSARPADFLLEVSEGLEPNRLIYTGADWAWWEGSQNAWLPVSWPELAKRYPLLPSLAAQRALQQHRVKTPDVCSELAQHGCPVFAPKSRYSLPDGTVLTARWDGDAQWWFDIADGGETVVTIENESGILYAELRSELGMGSRRKWRNGLFSYLDLKPCR